MTGSCLLSPGFLLSGIFWTICPFLKYLPRIQLSFFLSPPPRFAFPFLISKYNPEFLNPKTILINFTCNFSIPSLLFHPHISTPQSTSALTREFILKQINFICFSVKQSNNSCRSRDRGWLLRGEHSILSEESSDSFGFAGSSFQELLRIRSYARKVGRSDRKARTGW